MDKIICIIGMSIEEDLFSMKHVMAKCRSNKLRKMNIHFFWAAHTLSVPSPFPIRASGSGLSTAIVAAIHENYKNSTF